MAVELEVKGNFPQEWCHWNLEGSDLRSRETMLVGIYFDVPENWLETQPLDAIALNYHATVHIYLQYSDREKRELQTLSFHFCLRPDSLYLDFLPEGLNMRFDYAPPLIDLGNNRGDNIQDDGLHFSLGYSF